MSLSSRVRRSAAWAVAALAPLVLAGALVNGAQDHVVHGLRFVLPVLAVALPAVLLRRAPLAGLATMLACAFTATTLLRSWETGYLWDIRGLLFLLLDLAVAVIAAARPWRVSVGAAAVTLGVQVAAVVLHPLRDGSPALLVMALVIALLGGGSLRQRRARGEAQRARIAAQAVTAERTRIARDLHDMVAHTIGVIAIQAGAGSRVFHTQPAKAREALDAIEATSRETLAGLRHLLGELRSTDVSESLVAVDGASSSLADLDGLVASAARAGLRVDVRWRGDRRPLPVDLDLTAYRVVQEAVTNVLRHAATGTCTVTVDQREEELSLHVVDSGRGGTGGGGRGYGLIGMRERVELLRGDLTAGPAPAGGFAVSVRIPMTVAVR